MDDLLPAAFGGSRRKAVPDPPRTAEIDIGGGG